ncbi:MAG: NTP transferase domain-containing protein [bacterium]
MKKIKNLSSVENATNVRKRFLALLNRINKENTDLIITRDCKPCAALVSIENFEVRLRSGEKTALIVLGAKKCNDKNALKSISLINQSANIFSKIIFVCGTGTKKYAEYFESGDLRIVQNKKTRLPIITSLKQGITALSPDDDFLVFTFLSKPVPLKNFEALLKAVRKSRKTGKGIAILKVKGKPAHPVAISSKYFNVILRIRKELGLPYIIRKFRKDVTYAKAPD